MLVEDLDVFFRDFGVDATLNGGAAFRGFFSADYVDPFGMEATAPALRCASESVVGVKHNDVVVVNGTTYRVRGVSRDETGLETVLKLEEQ